jgi:hypothetical protein
MFHIKETKTETTEATHPLCVFNYRYTTTGADGQVVPHLSRGTADAETGEFLATRVENGQRGFLGIPLDQGFGTTANIYAKLADGRMVVENTPWTSPIPGLESRHGEVFPYDPQTGKWGEELKPGDKDYAQAVEAVNNVRYKHETIPTMIHQYAPQSWGGLPRCEIVGTTDSPVPTVKPKQSTK